MTANQTAAILTWLRTHPEGITPIDALAMFGCFRLAARIKDIKDGPFLRADESIETEMERHDGGRHARYRLVRVRTTLWVEDAA